MILSNVRMDSVRATYIHQEKFDEQYPANLLDELKGFDLVKYRACRRVGQISD